MDIFCFILYENNNMLFTDLLYIKNIIIIIYKFHIDFLKILFIIFIKSI